ncbi:MAG: hypothetical protein GY950_30870 [bacterium]|nr:hypothetical protein [bacterium]
MKKIIITIIGCMVILLFFLLSVITTGCTVGSKPGYQPTYSAPAVNSPLVVSYNESAREAGYRILNAGGNAFDAFVAVTVVENVEAYGYVTLAGLLSVLTFHADTNEIKHLDGGFNSVLDPAGAYDPQNPVTGKTIMVPGVIAGLESISLRYGRLSFAEVLQPAIEIARDGFPLTNAYAYYLRTYADWIGRTEYARRTFFPNGTALQAGDILRQPELAQFLTKLAEQGSSYMYTGEWAAQCVEAVREEGGLMTMEDLASYEPTWGEPWRMSYRGYDICASAGRSMHALWGLLALKTLEHTTIQPLGHFSVSADALEIVVRVARAVEEEYWINNPRDIDNRELVNSRLTLNYTASIWAKVEGRVSSSYDLAPPSQHTLCSVTADTGGNVVSGKHSINSGLWGVGVFVQGVVLNSTGEIVSRYTGPGRRRTQGAPNFLVFKDGPLRYACGTIGGSNAKTGFQFLVNVMDYGLSARESVELPRFGGFPFDRETWIVDYSRNELDKRISLGIENTLNARGLYFRRIRKVGTGCIAEFHSNGSTSSGWN